MSWILLLIVRRPTIAGLVVLLRQLTLDGALNTEPIDNPKRPKDWLASNAQQSGSDTTTLESGRIGVCLLFGC